MNNINAYLKLCRFDHITKHLFVVPGILFAIILVPESEFHFYKIIIGFISTFFIASANYIINEFLDRKYDKYHPIKKNRELVNTKLKKENVIIFYFIILLLGLIIGSQINKYFFYTLIIFILSGVIYNVKPFRFKNYIYLDVLTESFNNPIRLFLGWFMITESLISLPPISIILFYWFTGAFLMSTKRLAEIRFFNKFSNKKNLINYRPNYKYYNENNLLICTAVYLMLTSFNIAVFLLKYREELVLLYPFITLIFCWYFYLTLKPSKSSISPEKLYLNKYLIIFLIISGIIFLILLKIDMEIIKWLVNKTITIN